MANISNTDVTPINSTSYIDVVGLLVGERRLPDEATSTFARRLEAIVQSRKDHSYEGSLEQLNTELGFSTAPYMHITCSDPLGLLSFDFSGLHLKSTTDDITIPIATVAADTVLEWFKLSDVVAAVNNTNSFTATLLVPDALGFQLARQTNKFLVAAEPITRQSQTLEFGTYIPNSGYISSSSLTFSVTNGVINLDKTPAAGVLFAYEYITLPYDLVGSPVAAIGLTDPGFASQAVESNGAIVYQAREFIQQIMATDLSYWTK